MLLSHDKLEFPIPLSSFNQEKGKSYPLEVINTNTIIQRTTSHHNTYPITEVSDFFIKLYQSKQ